MRVPKRVNKPVDVFYLYPTAYQKTADGPVISSIDDPGMRKAARAAYGRQATAFKPVANIYARGTGRPTQRWPCAYRLDSTGR